MPYKLKMLLQFFPALWRLVIQYLPGDVGLELRYFYWKRRLKYLGDGVDIMTGVEITHPEAISIGDHCLISRGTVLTAGAMPEGRELYWLDKEQGRGASGELMIGRRTFIGEGVILLATGAGIHIAENCSISAFTSLYAYSHHYRSAADPDNREIYFGAMTEPETHCMAVGRIHLGRNVGVANKSVLLPGVTIESDSFVKAGSVVYPGAFAENSLLAGNPAKPVGVRFRQEV